MSWLSKNYEKAALGGAAVIALGLGVVGWLKVNKVDADFATELSGSGTGEPAVKDAGLTTKAISSLESPRVWDQADDNGRPVNLFTGIPLFIGKNSGPKAIDLVKSDPVHPPIPNQWWLQYRLDPGFGDSPLRDPDGDGFTNLDEFEGKTDPTDASSFPAPINKLVFVRDESVAWQLRPGYDADGGFPFTYTDSAGGQNKSPAGVVVKPGETFFAEGVMEGRFKFLGVEKRSVKNERTNVESEVTFVRIEDQKPNKDKQIYEIAQAYRQSDPAQVALYTQHDRTAVLRLDALKQGANEFQVEENTTFGLPSDSPNKDYLLKSVTPEEIEVEYTGPDGDKKTIKISKR